MSDDLLARRRVVVTGSEGFIGRHVCESLRAESGGAHAVVGLDLQAGRRTERVDVRSADDLRVAAPRLECDLVVHLAARAEVVVPLAELADVMSTNVNGTANVLRELQPRTCVLASSCAVYGDARVPRVPPEWPQVNPIGVYGMSKAAAELMCREWAAETGGASIVLRLGNVIGARCRGLIPHLVRHAVTHPDGSPPVRLRGNGALVRDYVPVDRVAAAVAQVGSRRWPAGTHTVFNIGSGRGTTNRIVAAAVQDVLKRHGYRLTLDFGDPPARGEALSVVLDVQRAVDELGLVPPTHDDIVATIEESVVECLEHDVPAGAEPLRIP